MDQIYKRTGKRNHCPGQLKQKKKEVNRKNIKTAPKHLRSFYVEGLRIIVPQANKLQFFIARIPQGEQYI